MKIGFIAHQVHRRGGMERVAAEILERIAKSHEVLVISSSCEVKSAHLQWLQVTAPQRPNLLYTLLFMRKARIAEDGQNCNLTISVNASVADADIISAHFCHAAFTSRFGGLRGGHGKFRRGYQAIAQHLFTQQERRAFTSPRLKKVIAVSEGVKRDLMEHYNLTNNQIEVVPNGVDHDTFKPAINRQAKQQLRVRLGLPEEAFVCLFVGGDWERKGLADAINAVAGLPGTYLAVVGRGKTEVFGEIAAKASAADRVLFFGSTATPQDYYAAADVFVFPSRYEAFSLATLEAAAAGLPIIATRINGTEELIEDGVNGFFIEPLPEAIREKLQLLKENQEQLRAMSDAILRSSQRYTWDRVAAENIRVLEDVCRSNYQIN